MLKYENYTLDNGMTVILHRDNITPMVVVNMLYKVGSKHEDARQTGLAHLFEHLMFTGTDDVPDFDIPIQKAGGENNAFTSNDITNYYSYAPAVNIELLLWLEADRMSKLNINKDAFEVQKRVVVEEFFETCIDEPYGDIWHHISDLAYKKYSYKWPVIGRKPSDIEKIKVEDVRNFYRKFYHPGNAILTVTGNFDPLKVKKMIRRMFDDVAPSGNGLHPLGKEPSQHAQRRKTVYANVSVPAIYMAFHIPRRHEEAFYPADLLSDVLANGRSSRLYQKLVKELQLFSSIDAYTNGVSDQGLLVIEGRLADKITPEQAEMAVWEILGELQAQEIDQRELDKIVNKTLTTLILSEYSATNKAMNLGYFESLGDVSLINREVDIYKKVNGRQLKQQAARIFNPRNSSVIYYLPQTNGQNTLH